MPFKLEDIGSNFGDLLMEDGRPSGVLSSLKIWERSNKKWRRNRCSKTGFQIADNSYAQMNREGAKC